MAATRQRRITSKQDDCLVICDDETRCDRKERTRGMCDSHYSIARLLVNDPKSGVTWAKLEAEGKAKPLAIKRGATAFFTNGKKR